MALDLSQAAAFQAIRAKEKARFEASEQEAAEAARAEAKAGGKRRAAGVPMTFEAVLQTCKDNDGYELPELNEKLYLHFKGFARIENLGAFTATKALFLESNGLNAIEGLEPLVELRCLYLQQNLLEHVVPPPGWNGAPLPLPGAPPAPSPLAHLVNLVTLDLSQNRLSVLSGLEGLVKLNTLNVAKNNLASVAGIEHLALCPSVTNIDLSGNQLADPAVLDVLERLPALWGGRQGGGDRHAARLVQKQGAAHEAELLQGRRSINLTLYMYV